MRRQRRKKLLGCGAEIGNLRKKRAAQDLIRARPADWQLEEEESGRRLVGVQGGDRAEEDESSRRLVGVQGRDRAEEDESSRRICCGVRVVFRCGKREGCRNELNC